MKKSPGCLTFKSFFIKYNHMNISLKDSKRAISPLLSTIILIFLAISIGILVMNWGRAQIEVGAKCAIDSEMQVVYLNGLPQVCYEGSKDSGYISFIIENGASVDVEKVQLRIIGGKKVYSTEMKDSFMKKGDALMKTIPYNFDLFGDIRQIKITPKISMYPGESADLCPEQALIIENVKEC